MQLIDLVLALGKEEASMCVVALIGKANTYT
jgi:hypothetical protein